VKPTFTVLVRVAVAAGLLVLALTLGLRFWRPAVVLLTGGKTIASAIDLYGSRVYSRLKPHFDRAGLDCPPERVAMLVFKRERRLELWAQRDGAWVAVKYYAIKGASGGLGPKLREGDRQVPEGVYHIAALNPNSRYHLSMKVNYPNAFDRMMALKDSRTDLGGDIFIHGSDVSIGCIAVGDRAIEELFVLVGWMWPTSVEVIISPCDLRGGAAVPGYKPHPGWTPQLYDHIRKALEKYVPARAG